MTNINYAYNRFCIERFPLPSESQVAALEERIRVTFPDDFREFILEFNGGYFNEPDIETVGDAPPSVLKCLFGIDASHPSSELGSRSSIVLFEDNDPPKILPIGSTPTGGLIILGVEPEVRGVIFLKQAWGNSYYLADGIEEFFDLLHTPPAAADTDL